MNLDTIEKLVKMMEQHGLTELAVHEGDLDFKARRGERRESPFMVQAAPAGMIHQQFANPQPAQVSAPVSAPTEAPKSGKKTQEICSPIVGTFYRKPNPNSPPFKESGEHVEKGDVVCIVEAMKVMNEIQSEITGTVVKYLVDDTSPVEFGQPLVLVEIG